MAWHGLFVLFWKGHFRFHARIIPKQFRYARKIFKNLFTGAMVNGNRTGRQPASRNQKRIVS
jgi:hypothetical protein